MESQVELFLSEAVLKEIRQLPQKPFCLRNGITDSIVANFLAELLSCASYVEEVPPAFIHPIDFDDSDYVNLAIATGAELIVSRDKHLLNLANPDKSWSNEFRARFPSIRIIQPPQFLAEWDKRPRPAE